MMRNLLLFSHAVVKTWRSSSFGYNIRRFRRFNNSLYFKCDDVEKGLKQQYIESKTYNNNENETKRSTNQLLEGKSGSSKRSVYVRRGLKTVGSLIAASLAFYITYSMGFFWYGLISIIIALVSILFITGKWRFLYIAAVTAPRDLT